MTMKQFHKYCKQKGLTRKIKSEFAELLGYDLWVIVNPKSKDNQNNAASVFLSCALSNGLSPFQQLRGNSILICKNKPITSDRIWGILNFIYDAMDYYDGTMEMTAKERTKRLEFEANEYKEGKWEPRGGCGGIDIYNEDSVNCQIPSF